jgi:repressor LexA
VFLFMLLLMKNLGLSQLKPSSTFLTQSQRKTLAFIKEYFALHQQSPTAKEIADGIGITSRGVVYRYLLALKDAGMIDLVAGRHRNIIITDTPPSQDLGELSILGTIAAGEPIIAVNEPQEWSWGINDSENFALRVQGDSMLDEGILNNDLVICRQASQAVNGDVVVALIDNEAVTLKRIFYHGQEVELRPANATHQPLLISAERVVVQGVLIRVVRCFD